MTELCITRGRDVGLFLDDQPLCGVTRFSAVSRLDRYEVYEYLCAAPYDAVPSGESHEIELTVLSLFADTIPARDGFTLSVEDNGAVYRYEGCSVTKREKDVSGDKAAITRYTVKAARMTKRGRENA